MKRTKTVGDTFQVARNWVTRDNDITRTPDRGGGNYRMFFEDNRIYSYGYHYLAGILLTNPEGYRIALVSIPGYSRTTNCHLYDIESACKWANVPVVRCEISRHNPAHGSAYNLTSTIARREVVQRAIECMDSMKSKRNVWRKLRWFDEVKDQLNYLRILARFEGRTLAPPELPELHRVTEPLPIEQLALNRLLGPRTVSYFGGRPRLEDRPSTREVLSGDNPQWRHALLAWLNQEAAR